MKKIIYSLIVLFALVSCEKETVKTKPVWDSTATILIRPANGVKTRTATNSLTALEIVQRGRSLKWHSVYFDNKHQADPLQAARGFNEEMKDYDIPALKMLAIDVISADGNYYRDLTFATDAYITDIEGDTIAYIPNEVISTARPLIEAAFNSDNYDEVYRLFNEAFTFLPIE